MSRVSGHRVRVSKNIFCIVFCILVIATCVRTPASAQLKKVARVGYLSGVTTENDKPMVTALRHELRELGYTEGKDIIIEERYAAGRSDKLTEAAKELVDLKVGFLVNKAAFKCVVFCHGRI